MKISTWIGILLVVGSIFFIFSQMVTESNDIYSTNISSSEWNTKYDYATRVNDSIAPIQKSFNNIEEASGWFSFLTAGVSGIFRGVTALPNLVFSSFAIGGLMITGFFTTLGLPAYILVIATILLIVWGITKLIEVIQRWQV